MSCPVGESAFQGRSGVGPPALRESIPSSGWRSSAELLEESGGRTLVCPQVMRPPGLRALRAQRECSQQHRQQEAPWPACRQSRKASRKTYCEREHDRERSLVCGRSLLNPLIWKVRKNWARQEPNVTAVALANQNASQATTMSVTLRDQDGKLLGNDSVDLEPLARSAFVLASQFPVTVNTQGVAEFFAPNVDVSALGLRFNPRGSFTSISIF